MYTIVISDDEKGICEGLYSIISGSFPECTVTEVFHDGALLYDYLQVCRPDIILLDIEMPGRSGLEIARFVHESSMDSQIIMITAHSKFEYARDAVNYHVTNFITKPFSSEELIRTLQKAMAGIAHKRAAADSLFHARRSLVRNLVNNTEESLSMDALLLCGNTAPIQELSCTETAFLNIETDFLQTGPRPCLASLQECAESDSPAQSTFLLEAEKDHILFLTFHKENPDLSFIPGIQKLLSVRGSSSVRHVEKHFPSFEHYRMERLFGRRMDAFWNQVAADGPREALNQLALFLRASSGERLRHFISWLNENYPVSVTDTEPDAILSGLEPLIDQSLNVSSGMPIVKAAQEYILGNFDSASLSRSSVAEHLGISDAHFSRLFTKYLGQTFSDYLLNLRMNQAKHLLKTTDMSTVAIAKSVGYYNPEYFRTAFKTYCGMTPRNFRLLTAARTGKE